MAFVVEIWRYPVKSMAGESLDSCPVGEQGLEDDRRLALVHWAPIRGGKPGTLGEEDRLMTYRARLAAGILEVLAPTGEVRALDEAMVSHLATEASRSLTLRDLEGANFDDSPVLLVNLATVAAFEAEAGMRVDRRRFRANLYVDGLEPSEEIAWLGRHVAVGGIELAVIKQCERCVVITRDPDTPAAAPALWRVLTETRETYMGVYCEVTRPGRVAVGDPVHVV